jgi:hypothetical protein
MGEHVGDGGLAGTAADEQVGVGVEQVREPPATTSGGVSLLVTASSSQVIRSCCPKVTEIPRMSTSPDVARPMMSSSDTLSCMSISSTCPSNVERAARARSEIASGNRGSGKFSG